MNRFKPSFPFLTRLGTIVALGWVASVVLSAPEELPQQQPARVGGPTQPDAATSLQATAPEPGAAPVPAAAYVGTNQCFTCHRPQTNTWSETKHAHAFTDLPKKYQGDASCLKCHVTGFGQPAGFVAGTDKDLLMVGCETCHGPGEKHIDAAKRFVLADPGEEAKIEKELRDTIRKMPPDRVCISCHIGQAHQKHPAYDGQPSSTTDGRKDRLSDSVVSAAYHASPAGPRASHYTVKTCGGCHYDQYQRWRRETHADLFAMLPAKYQSDQSCVSCHRSAGFAVMSAPSGADPHHERIGVACESCHGPALEHIRFNKQFISGPRLGPKLELAARNTIRKGKSATSCIDCHASQGHKEHPKVEAK
jgi:hypothetical protein